MITNKIKQFYRLFGQEEGSALRTFQRYFPEPYTLNEITHDTAEDFASHNEVANQALLIGVEIGKAVAFQKRPILLNAKYSTKMGIFAQKKNRSFSSRTAMLGAFGCTAKCYWLGNCFCWYCESRASIT